jgi:outer membrane cobalamin receptor
MPRSPIFILASGLLFAFSVIAGESQTASPPATGTGAGAPGAKPAPVLPRHTETMVVLGSASPVPLGEAAATVFVLPVQSELLRVETPLDILREDPSVFLEQRGAGGAQSDVVLRGGGFAQTLVLVNGFRINDSQTAHHNLDLPIPLEAMEQIQVLHGAGSTLHGADALAGAVDFLTAAPASGSLLLRAGGGNFGENEQGLMAGGVRGAWSGRITGDRNFSTGFKADRDYRNEDASAEGWAGSRAGITDVLFAGSDRAFGADQFYGPFPSWERTKSWFASVQQDIGEKTVAAFGYRRHSDEFVLIRDEPAIYENNHVDSSWQASLRRTQPAGGDSLVLFGLEADGDSIHSNNLGRHARNRGAGYADWDFHPAKRRWMVSAGMREEIFSGGARSVLSPHLAASRRITDRVKVRGNAGYGFRIPTYTDLYYSDPTTVGNANLKPESAWSGEAGMDWMGSRFTWSATGFYSHQHDTIDYVRSSPADRWHAENLRGLRFRGLEWSSTWQPGRGQSLRVGWTALFGAQDALHGMQSEYVFNYPVENVRASWNCQLGRYAVVSNEVQIAQRFQQSAYPVWNAGIARSRGDWRPYLRLRNGSNTGYEEISGVPMPGRSVVAGLVYTLGR